MEIEAIYWEKAETVNGWDKGGFDDYYQVFTETLTECLCYLIEENGTKLPEFDDEWLVAFQEQVRKITFRTLILEMNLSRQCGELEGETGEELYQSFVRTCLISKEWLQEIYQEYPVMYRAVMRCLKNTVENTWEMLERFEADKQELNNRYFTDCPCSRVQRIGGGSSDSHRGGKRVCILELDNGKKLVYKPRNMAVDVAYREFVLWVSEHIGVSYEWSWLWDKGEYGWCEWIAACPCDTREQLGNYYVRNGILMAVSYLLGTGDIHYENLIAHGEMPIIIDLEMGIGYRKIAEGLNTTESVYQDSVIHTGLLPLYVWSEDGEGVNVGAIDGKGGQLVPIEMPVVVEGGTVDMHVEYRQPRMQEGKNLATWGEHFIEPSEFLDEIKDGFQAAYRYLFAHKEAIDAWIRDKQDIPVRYLLNDTQSYSMLLSASYFPEYVSDESQQEEWLRNIRHGRRETKSGEWGVQQEIEELKQGDIPYFWCYIGKTDLFSATGSCKKNFLEETVIKTIMERLERMDEKSMYRQLRLITAALMMGKEEEKEQESPEREKTKTSASEDTSDGKDIRLGIAGTMGDILLEEAVWSEDKQEIGWISLMMAGYRERSYLIRPMGMYLYDGLAGVAVFMAALARATGNARYREAEKVLVSQLWKHTKQFAKEEKSEKKHQGGAFNGEASIAYAYQILYRETGDKSFLDYMELQCRAVREILAFDTICDVLGGNAGAILVFLNAYDLTGDEMYRTWAKEAGDYLCKAAKEDEFGRKWVQPLTGKPLTGFAHGASGIMLALARLSYVTQETKYDRAAHDAFLFESRYYQPEVHDWLDLRYTMEQQEKLDHSSAWCHGRGGIVMAQKAALRYVQGDWKSELEEAIERCGQEKGNYQNRGGYSLCHGRLGRAVLRAGLEEKSEGEEMLREIFERLYQSKDHLKDILPRQERENYGLMSGMAGIGYSALCEIETLFRYLRVEI